MLRRTPQMLTKSGIKQSKHICVEKQSAVKPHDEINWRERRGATLIVVSRLNTQGNAPYPFFQLLPYPEKYIFILLAGTSLFSFVLFLKIQF